MKNRTLLIQLALFIVTVVFTTFAGMEWVSGKSILFSEFDPKALFNGFKWYTLPFLGFLTVHEFGHYFMAKRRKIKVTLPYYVPFWFGYGLSFGSMGAFIQIKELLKSRLQYFDIGISGPLAGFVVALGFLIYGYSHLPSHEFVYGLHPEYRQYGAEYGKYVYSAMADQELFRMGDSILSAWIKSTFADSTLLPHENELMHYPYILAGFLGLFFTALNLMPIGQLDGGHILFALIGQKWFNLVSPIIFITFVFYAGLGFFSVYELQSAVLRAEYSVLLNFLLYVYVVYLSFSRLTKSIHTNWILALGIVFVQLLLSLFFPELQGYSGFLAFALLLGRFLGIYHPAVIDHKPLNKQRILLGWLSLLIFVLCFSPRPFY